MEDDFKIIEKESLLHSSKMLSATSASVNTGLLASYSSINLSHGGNEPSQLQTALGKRLFDLLIGKQQKNDVRNRKKRVKINVSGRLFETYERTLKSREGSIFKMKNVLNYFDKEKQEYYFDRDPRSFEAILTYLQCGLLLQPENVAYKVFLEDLQFFGFGKAALDIFKTGHGQVKQEKENSQHFVNYDKPKTFWRCMTALEANGAFTILNIFGTLMIVFSLFLFCIETLPNITKEQKKVFKNLETFCVIWFTVELAARFAIAENKCRFVINGMNIIDLISILPFYIDLIVFQNNNLAGFAILRALRAARIFRIFKLYRYSKAIHLLIYTFVSSISELLLLIFFMIVLLILFSAGIYFFENNFEDPSNKFKSIPHTFWFAIVTLTTVGYGDMVPSTSGGKIISAVLSVTGVLVIALPIPIIVNNFRRFYDRMMSRSPAYQFEFDLEKSNEVKNEDFRGELKQ
ncbi:potassium voltage-gated channel subfamily A member 10-like isoform X1 [Hydractinia symbiolongicarpus]|uniref:potassium voltage-gated channel subfamily A member 10-like isoform X1 n=2 Tax=Hydractinia symbiolongicarpus TaxID=13093 RepID=UPI00254A01C0|nr:potassium voltage-gated channel subfamily A member 10-like isoform X1 [Hydractinia symbiolongicarpus]